MAVDELDGEDEEVDGEDDGVVVELVVEELEPVEFDSEVEVVEPLPDFSALTLPERESLR
ncbi:hypothetical protein AB0M02_01575 [Actinoplanes sp. NPDC051861]|uniref:hypothetical protein n=1 Tax=Actinoplanes sp. NPDC051861 TaxID=3155170 RepID=UPI003434FCD9